MNLSDAKICTFDLETTGTDIATDRIIQCSFSVTQAGRQIGGFATLLDPERLILPEIVELTGIQQDHVAGGPKFRDIIPAITELIAGCDLLAGFNIVRFDIAMLCEEFIRAGHDYQPLLDKPVYDVGMVFTKLEPRTLSAAMQFYCNRELQNAHDATADTDATEAVMHAQAERYKLASKSLNELDKLSRFDDMRTPDPAGKLKYDAEGRVCFNTFRNRGVPVIDDEGYAIWMLNNGFPEATKAVIRRVLDEASAPVRKAVGLDQAHDHVVSPQATIVKPVASALDRQVGGRHYKSLAIQPVEYIEKNKIPYTEGCVIKYVTRHREKGGADDLKKAIHFIEMLLEREYPKAAATAG